MIGVDFLSMTGPLQVALFDGRVLAILGAPTNLRNGVMLTWIVMVWLLRCAIRHNLRVMAYRGQIVTNSHLWRTPTFVPQPCARAEGS